MPVVLVPLAGGCEELEAVTIIDLLRRAGIEVVTAGLDEQPVTASRGVRLLADTTLDEALGRDYDMVVLPGGTLGAENLERDPRIRTLLLKMAEQGRYTAAICAAPRVLANVGVLNGRCATSYPGALQGMQARGVRLSHEAVVQDGPVITSRSPGTAMDFALALIGVLLGAAKRDAVELQLARS
ncbi:MAG: DJ-1 family glyoxalase III [Gammaproteobacteria bacterium]